MPAAAIDSATAPSSSPSRQPSHQAGSSPVPASRNRRTVFKVGDKLVRRSASGSLRNNLGPVHDFGPADLKKLKVLLRADLWGNAWAFWEALKIVVVKKYGNTEAAWSASTNSQDETMSLDQFQGMCMAAGLELNSSMLRILFESRLRKFESVWTLQDFFDAITLATPDRIRIRLQEYKRSQAAIRANISSFLKHLSLCTGELNQRRAVTRFQRKLTVAFCQDIWKSLQQWVMRRLGTEGDSANDIGCEDFIKVLASTGRLQEYEFDFLRHIFDRVDRSTDRNQRGLGHVTTLDLAVALTLLGTDSNHYEKAWFLFSVFDSDSDGCLTREQILRMYCCTVIHGNIARNDTPMYNADVALGDELSLAKARRLYDFTLTLFEQVVEDDLYSFQEWWGVLKGNEMLRDELLPGCSRIMWVLDPRRVRSPEKAPKEDKAMRRSMSKTRWGRIRRNAIASSSTLLNNSMGSEAMVQGVNSTATAHNSTSRLPAPAPTRGSGGDVREMRATDNFRMHAAIRFRHAVRGEWDRIDALRVASGATNKLPQMGGPGNGGRLEPLCRTVDASSPDLAAATAAWIDSFNTFKHRNKYHHWNLCHGETLSNWSRATGRPITADDSGCKPPSAPGMMQSKSLPEIGFGAAGAAGRAHGRPRQDFRQHRLPSVGAQGSSEIHLGVSSSQQAQKLQQRAAAVFAKVSEQAKHALDAMPQQIEHFGDDSMDRFRCVPAGGACDTPGEGQPAFLPYECKLCGIWHDSAGLCVGTDK